MPIGALCVMSCTRFRNECVRPAARRAHLQLSSLYVVVLLYKTVDRSIPSATTHGVVAVVAKGTRVEAMGGGWEFSTGSTDIEHDTD